MDDTSKDVLECSFCHKKQWEVRKLIAGVSVYICDECVNLCHEILDQESNGGKVSSTGKPLTPQEIAAHLDQYIIGQDYAKQVVSVAVSNHYKRLKNPIIDDVELDKANIILIGPTGSGKTLLAKTLARKLNVPLAIADATSLTEAGYMGDDVESIISRLHQVAGGDKAKTETGIVFIDEIDKKAKRSDGNSVNRDISGEGVQQALLKLMEGDKVKIASQGGKRNNQSEIIEIDTSNILFIVGGAFVGLETIVNQRTKGSTSIGFGARVKSDMAQLNSLSDIQAEDLVKFGLIPELIGRLPVVTYLEELTQEQLIKIITEPKNALAKQYQKMFKLENVDLEFTQSGLEELARLAKERKTGARGLRSVLENVLVRTQFNLSTLKEQGLTKVIVDEQTIKEKSEPKMVFEIDKATKSQ